MKTCLGLIALCACSLSFASPIQERKIDRAAVAELASALGIPKEADLIAATQNRWLHKMDKERWDWVELPPEDRKIVLNWVKETQFFAEWKPASKVYDKALIGGATTGAMRKRLEYLKQLWNEGVRFSEVVWLTGDRTLDPRADGLTDRCSLESEAARLVWEETALPQEMHQLPVVFIAAPPKSSGRPGLKDAMSIWLTQSPTPCSVLFVSSQPYCGYQFSCIEEVLPDPFLFDVVGPATDINSRPVAGAITLDVIARWLYQEQ